MVKGTIVSYQEVIMPDYTVAYEIILRLDKKPNININKDIEIKEDK